MSCLQWFGAGVIVAFAVGIAMVVAALWPEEGAWWLLALGAPFFLLALHTIYRVVTGPTYIIGIDEEGILSVERRVLGLRFKREYPLTRFTQIRVREVPVGITPGVALIRVREFTFHDTSGRAVLSIPVAAIETPGAFLQAVRRANSNLDVETRRIP